MIVRWTALKLQEACSLIANNLGDSKTVGGFWGGVIKKLLGTVAAFLLLGAGAPAFAQAPVFNWTGFYIGANLGYGVARNPSESILLSGGLPQFTETFNLSPHGLLGGGQVGFNWQAAPNWVLGIEADLQASAQTDSTTCVTRCRPTSSEFTRVAQKLPWFGALRGRLGWTNGPALYYLTGGWAFGQVTTDVAVNLGPGVDSRSFSHNLSGWTIGGGIEAQIGGNWTAKVEYLYVDLGRVTDSFVYIPFPSVSYVESSAIRNHIVRLGLNYKFGAPVHAEAAQSALAQAPIFNWTGFYLGGNFGYGVASNPSQSTLFLLVNPQFLETFNLSPHGLLGGGQLGYNWQVAPNWVFGIEADIQASAQTDSTTCVTTCVSPSSTQVSQKLPWFGTLRGRLGWTNGPALFYLTGGWAFGNVTTDVAADIGSGVDSRSFSHNLSGWTIGGGIEAQIGGNWTAKVEYLYVDLGSITDSFVYTPFPTISYAESSAIRNHVARIALNYKFGGPN